MRNLREVSLKYVVWLGAWFWQGIFLRRWTNGDTIVRNNFNPLEARASLHI